MNGDCTRGIDKLSYLNESMNDQPSLLNLLNNQLKLDIRHGYFNVLSPTLQGLHHE